MRFVAAILATLIAMLGLGLAVPALAGTASACSCAATGNLPSDLVVIAGEVEKQRIGGRYTDVQVRVTSMYGVPPERITVVRAESAGYSSCGSEFRDGGGFRMVVERDGARWTAPLCANIWLSKFDEQGLRGTPPTGDAPETRLPGPPISWLYALIQPSSLIFGAVLLAFGIVAIAVWRRVRSG